MLLSCCAILSSSCLFVVGVCLLLLLLWEERKGKAERGGENRDPLSEKAGQMSFCE